MTINNNPENKQAEPGRKITLDVNNMFAARLGEEQGIRKSQVAELKPRAREVHYRIQEQKPGFARLPYRQDKVVSRIREMADERAGDYDNFVVLGIGGSALGNIALQTALNDPYYNLNTGSREGYPRLFVPDNVDPERFAALLDLLDLERTVFNVISKSGSTAETMSLYLLAREAVAEEVGQERVAEHFIATTSRDSGYLIEIAEREGYPSFSIPDDVGGRFSVLTPVGLLSAAFTGVNISELLAGAAEMAERCRMEDIWENPAYLHGALQYLAYQEGKIMSVMMPYSHALKDLADWYRQLWAESLGKEVNRRGERVNVGPTPIKALGATDQHSQVQLYMEGPYDKIITFIEVENHQRNLEMPELYRDLDGINYLGGHSLARLLNTEKQATERALTKRGRANATIKVSEVSAFTLGQLFYLLEMETAFVGELFDINTYNQPGVELGKNYTYGILGREGYQDKKAEFKDWSDPDPELIL